MPRTVSRPAPTCTTRSPRTSKAERQSQAPSKPAVTSIGRHAFYRTGHTGIDLSPQGHRAPDHPSATRPSTATSSSQAPSRSLVGPAVTLIGENAFRGTDLTELNLSEATPRSRPSATIRLRGHRPCGPNLRAPEHPATGPSPPTSSSPARSRWAPPSPRSVATPFTTPVSRGSTSPRPCTAAHDHTSATGPYDTPLACCSTGVGIRLCAHTRLQARLVLAACARMCSMGLHVKVVRTDLCTTHERRACAVRAVTWAC